MTKRELSEILLLEKPSTELRNRKDELATLISEFSDSFEFDQKNVWHPYDVFEHTLRVIDGVPDIYNLRIAALFHDIGKPYTMKIDSNGNGHFYGHWDKSKDIFLKYKDRFFLGFHDIDLVCKLIEYHDLPVRLNNIKNFITHFNPNEMELLFSLKKADILAQNSDFLEEGLKKLEKQEKIYSSVLDGVNSKKYILEDSDFNG